MMHTSSSILPQNGVSGVYHLEEKSGKVSQICQRIAVGYAHGFLFKWLRGFRKPEILIVSDEPVETLPWEKTFRTPNVSCISHAEALGKSMAPLEPATMLVVFDIEGSTDSVLKFSPLLQRGGAFLWFTRNRHREWKQVQAEFDGQSIGDMFALGFHPKGAVAWWPYNHPLAVLPGKLVDILVTFFLYKNGTARRFGKLWMIRGIKHERVTQLS